MIKIKFTDEIRVETEEEVKKVVEKYQQDYNVIKWSSDYKKKSSKGEIIDEGYLVKITCELAKFWGET